MVCKVLPVSRVRCFLRRRSRDGVFSSLQCFAGGVIRNDQRNSSVQVCQWPSTAFRYAAKEFLSVVELAEMGWSEPEEGVTVLQLHTYHSSAGFFKLPYLQN